MFPESVPLDGRSVEVGASKSILEYWESVRGTKFAPAFGAEFKLLDLGVDVIPCSSVVDVIDAGATFRYRFWGTLNVDIKGFEMTGKCLEEGPIKEVETVGHLHFGEVMKRGEPVAFVYRGVRQMIDHTKQITFRYPLSSDGRTVDKIFSWQNLNDRSGSWVKSFEDFWQAKKDSDGA